MPYLILQKGICYSNSTLGMSIKHNLPLKSLNGETFKAVIWHGKLNL